MKLRSITVSDIRQFTQPVTVKEIGDGLNVLSAPNESGKSTLFDAIQALFFIPHSSSKISPLRPDVGGNPEITIEIETDAGVHRLHKRWGRGKLAEVWRAERLIAKGDEAEAFITGLTSQGTGGGPAGLLWVRQGLTDLEQGSKKEQQTAQDARRDLLSSVTGEFDAMTGGKRMDRALSRARADLGALITQRGAKAGGPYDMALSHLSDLDARFGSLSETRQHLQKALDQRRRQRRLLADLTDPAEVALRTDRLTAAQTRFDTAERHAQALSAAESRVDAAHARLTTTTNDRARAERVIAAIGTLSTDLQSARDQQKSAAKTHEEARAALAEAKTAATVARDAMRAAESELREAHQAELHASQLQQRSAKQKALVAAQTLIASLPALKEAAATGPDAKGATAIDEAHTALKLAEAIAANAAPKITMTYDAKAPQASIDGQPLTPDEALPIATPQTVELPGIGRLHIDPGGGDRQDATERARSDLSALLRQHGLDSAENARSAARARQEAVVQYREAQAALSHLAPDGVETLKAEVAQLNALPTPDSAIDPKNAKHLADVAEKQSKQADIALHAAQARYDAQMAVAQKAAITVESLNARLTDARADTAAAADLTALKNAETDAQKALQSANTALDEIKATTPDRDTAKAALNRARDVARRAETETQTLREDLARLDARIEVQAGNGIDEDLAEVSEQCEQARAVVEAFKAEIAVLQTLITALETAQASARDRYFTPVLTELRPMLRLLWPDAELRFDGDSLLPSELVRDGHAEALGSLSGGTREQIALLVRLAFARLLARGGTSAPVILDDALVYTDDDRIERMFDALHAQAPDLQILVFSCRNRALHALGGRKLRIEPTTSLAGENA